MAHIQLLNDKSKEYTEESLLDLNCKRDPCLPEVGGGGYTLGAPIYEEEHIEGPIQACHWP